MDVMAHMMLLNIKKTAPLRLGQVEGAAHRHDFRLKCLAAVMSC
jgi:hypothetical protein